MPAYKYKTKAGKTFWYANFYFTDWTGQKQHKCKRGFATRREAQEWERNFLEYQSKDPTILFEALVERYLEENTERVKPSTAHSKKSVINKRILPYFKGMRICDIDPASIMHWQNSLLAYRDENGNPFSQTYLNGLHGRMSAIMNYAVKFYGLRANPCRAAGTIGKGRASEMKIWTKDQFDQFLEHTKKKIHRLAFTTFFYSGIREGELLALTPADVYDDLLDINKNYAKIKGKEYFLTPKTAKSIRKVTIPESLYKELRDYIAERRVGDGERIFDRTKDAFLAAFHRCAERAGLPQIRIHDLRHSHVALLIDMGFSIEEIAERLGHESAATTWGIYAHLYPGKDRELAKKLDEKRRTNITGLNTAPSNGEKSEENA